jgi:hypothetical protein
MKSPAIAILVLLSAPVALPAAVLTGLWEFDDQSNPGAATVGVPLSFAGAAPGTWSAALSDDQADSLAGVLTTPPAAAATRFIATHGIAPNGGGAYVNEYSVLVDLFSPAGSRAAWRTIFQTNENNTNDADYFISPTGNAGVSALTYSPAALDASSWTRLVVTFDLASAGPSVVRTYLNGAPFHTHALSGGLDSALLHRRGRRQRAPAHRGGGNLQRRFVSGRSRGARGRRSRGRPRAADSRSPRSRSCRSRGPSALARPDHGTVTGGPSTGSGDRSPPS